MTCESLAKRIPDLTSPTDVDLGIFRADYLAIGHVRTDPIITQSCLSDHVHTFYGPPLLFPKVTHTDLVNSDPDKSSGNIRENLSLYWHPSVYRVEDNGERTLLEPYWMDVYYTYEVNATRAFPNGFQMIAGYDEGDATTDCDEPTECTRGDCTEINDFFPKNACRQLKISMAMPRCWDETQGIDSPDHMKHVTYPDEVDAPFEGECPESHSTRLPFLEIDIRYKDYLGGPHEFSDGSGNFHTDYLSGWDENFFQKVLDNCNQDASEELCTKVPFTWRDDIIDPFDEEKLVELLYDNPVPPAETKCISEEKVTGITNLPRGTCSGELASADGICTEDPCPENTDVKFRILAKKSCNYLRKEKLANKFCDRNDPFNKQKVFLSCPKQCDADDYSKSKKKIKVSLTMKCKGLNKPGKIRKYCRLVNKFDQAAIKKKIKFFCPKQCNIC